MFARIVAVVMDTVVGWAHSIEMDLIRLMDPARSVVTAAVGATRDTVRSRADLIAENALLRQQLIVIRRKIKRPALRDGDRILMVLLARWNSAWRDALHLVKPDTLLRWHRDIFKLIWRRKSRSKGDQPKRLNPETCTLIRTMARDNVTWGAERIRGELLKLGIRVSKRTIQKYMKQARPPAKRGQTWGTFLNNHADDIWACDFLQLYDVLFRPIFAFFVVKHGTREVVHVGVTRTPSDRWVAQQLRESTPFGEGPKYLIRDNDGKYGARFSAVAETTGINVVKIPPRSPNLNPICERYLGSVRRECLDHVVILCNAHLRKVLTEYVQYFDTARPHQGLSQNIPGNDGIGTLAEADGEVIAIPVLGGLHHDYRTAA